MKRSSYILISVIILLFASCRKGDGDRMTVSVNLFFNQEWDTTEQTYESNASQTRAFSTSAGDYDIRYVVNAYPLDADGNYDKSNYIQTVVTEPYRNYHNKMLTISLPCDSYKLVAWSDCVDANTTENKFYDVSDFSGVIMNVTDGGSNKFKDAFCGESVVTVSPLDEDNPSTVVTMERPLAKIEFVSTEVQAFITAENSRLKQVSRSVDIRNYRYVISYPGFYPSSLNAFTSKPNDSSSGVQIEGYVSIIDETTASLGFDYVYVNHAQTTIPVKISVYAPDGTCVSATTAIEVPIQRNCITVVKGNLLTSKAFGGVSIDPSFNGDIFINYVW